MASFVSSESSAEIVDAESGGRPDLLSSPEVFTWRRMFRGEVRSGERYLLRAVAALVEVTVWMA